MSTQDWRQPRALAWYQVGSQMRKSTILSRAGDICTIQVFITFRDFVGTPITRSYTAKAATSKLKKRVE